MTTLLDPVGFAAGPVMRNRFMLAPLTNTQSHADGSASAEDLDWLTTRAKRGRPES